MSVGMQGGHGDEEAEGCLCNIDIAVAERTKDQELPAARGGVAVTSGGSFDDELVEGCDLDFTKEEPTRDDQLPVASGGVE